MLRVAINCQLASRGEWGGVEQFIIGLVSGLARLNGEEEYLIIVNSRMPDWLNAYIGPNQRIVVAPASVNDWFKRQLGPWRVAAGKLWRKAKYHLFGVPFVIAPKSNGYFESLGVDVVHFPFQVFTYCDLPTIFNPHDLQHLHYPQFFKREDLAARNASFPFALQYAHAIVTDCMWVKRDVAQQYTPLADKIFAIPMGPPTELYGAVARDILESVRGHFNLPQIFAFYPAQTWQHKNHVRLLEALALLRDRDHITLYLICTGKQNEFYRVIAKRVQELHLESQVRFLGFIEPEELRALYHLAQFVIHPSLFEGGGLPILEAFREGTPVACSNLTSLPEYAGDAALYFDPTNAESIADAAMRMMKDESLRELLRERGKARIESFTWERTARMYRALYRKVGGVVLSEEDIGLLNEAARLAEHQLLL
jgi:glycosyltransferase involved in cell wall biosynthesis